MSADVLQLPIAGFTRGAICRPFVDGELAGPNILVVKTLGASTVGIMIDSAGGVSLGEWDTRDLRQVLPEPSA
jgi:phosphoribosylformimino-5-aminoimidazole carboxamide ribonucleotide (ProFAR) isomerase